MDERSAYMYIEAYTHTHTQHKAMVNVNSFVGIHIKNVYYNYLWRMTITIKAVLKVES
jgi:hypothetical protein